MIRDSKKRSYINLIEEIWEEIEIQIYGILGATVFFVLVYLFFQPTWMKPIINFFYNIKLSL